MTSAEIRSLRDDEVATYVELRNAIDPRTATMPGWVEHHRRSETTVRIVLAHEGDDVVGVGSAQEEADRRGLDVGWLSFGVVPEHRSKGVGGALYRELSRHLRTLGKPCATRPPGLTTRRRSHSCRTVDSLRSIASSSCGSTSRRASRTKPNRRPE
jgi:GNAT superfamily N-acetyltransferase